MEIRALQTIWATTPVVVVVNYEEQRFFINKRSFQGNRQTDFSAVEFQVFGEVLNQKQRIYTSTPPPIMAGDYLYSSEPHPIGKREIDGVEQDIYPKGEAVAQKPKRQYEPPYNPPINPTSTLIQFEAVQE